MSIFFIRIGLRPDVPIEETMGALAQMVRQGKALYVGISSYSAERTRRGGGDVRSEGVSC